jgi:hypothetical protein
MPAHAASRWEMTAPDAEPTMIAERREARLMP